MPANSRSSSCMTTAIIVAAGRGTRMGPDVDKLFLPVAGAPVVAHTWRRFEGSPEVDQLVLVVRAGMEGAFRELAAEHGFRKPFQLVAGGAERQDSVWNGLAALPESAELVAIQDGARPCTPLPLVARTLAAARRVGAAVAAQRATDTMKESDGGTRIQRHLDRARLWAVQTPQCFRVEVIRRALEAVRQSGRQVTDDTAACELIGQPVELVESSEPNPKVTTRGDLPWVELLLRS
jgi:2-C-methyl-D-erythritol 4-phosphate cytidylyltransferase